MTSATTPGLIDLTAHNLTPADARHLAAVLQLPGTLVAAGRDVLEAPEAGWQLWKAVTDLYPASPEAWLLTQLAASLTGRWWWQVWAPLRIGGACAYRPALTLRQLRTATHRTSHRRTRPTR